MQVVSVVGRWVLHVYLAVLAFVIRVASLVSGLAFIFIVVVGYAVPIGLGIWLVLHLPWLLLLLVTPWLSAIVGRRQELAADRVSTRLGYGPALVETYERWLLAGDDEAHAEKRFAARMLSSHPTMASRIRAIEERLTV